MKNEPTNSIGTAELCAWPVSETHCKIQTSSPQLAKLLKRLPDCQLVGWSVTGRFLRIFDIQRTLPWIKREVIEKKHPVFIKKYDSRNAQIPLPSVLIAETSLHSGEQAGRA